MTNSKTATSVAKRSGNNPQVVNKYAFNGKFLTAYRRGNEKTLYFSCVQIRECNGLKPFKEHGGQTVVRSMNKKNCFSVITRNKKGKFYKLWYASYDEVISYLQRSKTKVSSNLYVFLLSIARQEQDKKKAKKERTRKATNNTATLTMETATPSSKANTQNNNEKERILLERAYQTAENMPVTSYVNASNNSAPVKRSTAETLFDDWQPAEKEKPGHYFNLQPFFETGAFSLDWVRANKSMFEEELKDALAILLKVGEPLRDDNRQEFTTVISCLASHQSLLESI